MAEQSTDSVPSPKRQKFVHVGAARYRSKFKNKWSSMYPVRGAKNDQYSFYCIPCMKNITWDHHGITLKIIVAQRHTKDMKSKRNLSPGYFPYLNPKSRRIQLLEQKLSWPIF